MLLTAFALFETMENDCMFTLPPLAATLIFANVTFVFPGATVVAAGEEESTLVMTVPL